MENNSFEDIISLILEDIRDKLQIKKNFQHKTIKTYRIFVTILFILFWIAFLIHTKQNFFIMIFQLLTMWGVILTTIHFIKSIFTDELEIKENNHFFHLILTMEIFIFFGYWIFVFPYHSFEKETNLYVILIVFEHFIIQILLLIEYIINKSFFFNSKKNFFLHFLVFMVYLCVNILLVKVFDIVPYENIRWESIWEFLMVILLIVIIFLIWHLILFFQRFKIYIKDEHKHDRNLKKHFWFQNYILHFLFKKQLCYFYFHTIYY